MAEIVSAFKDL